ncbi:MAG: VTT domain-containing protein [Puniceicoccaceae bacterium]|nr:VTT domain-containing protein [Puniceicoccaceae bacterium]
MSESIGPKRRLQRKPALLLVLGVVSAMAVMLVWQRHPEAIYWLELLDLGHIFLKENPWVLFVVLTTLPGLGFPSSATLMLFGVVVAPHYGMPAAVALAIAAQSLCSIWTYGLAAGPLKRLLRRYLLRERALPKMSEHDAVRLGLILRLTPGIPYALQNIILGSIGMRFRDYLLVSIPTTSLWTVCFVMTGGAIFKGQLGWAITGTVILIVVILATQMWNRKNPTHVR